MKNVSRDVSIRVISWWRRRRVKTLGLLACACLLPLKGVAGQMLLIEREHSRVEVAVGATVDSFIAELAAYDADVVVEPATGRVTQAHFRFKFADLLTGKASRDRHMHEWQHTAEFPEGEFTLADLTAGVGGRMVARGTLFFHGVRKELEFPVTVTRDQALYAVDGAVPLDTRDFGLPVIRKLLLLKVDPVVTVRFHLQGRVSTGR